MGDTGTQVCVADISIITRMGIPAELLTKPTLNVSVANSDNLQIVGVAFIMITSPTGSVPRMMVYVTSGVNEFYLSKQACRELGIINGDFSATSPNQPLWVREPRGIFCCLRWVEE